MEAAAFIPILIGVFIVVVAVAGAGLLKGRKGESGDGGGSHYGGDTGSDGGGGDCGSDGGGGGGGCD